MSYKTILIHLDESPNIDARINLAAQLALTHEAHLIGLATTGISRYFYESMATAASEAGIGPYMDTLRERASARLQHFEDKVRQLGVSSYEKHLADDEAEGCLALRARYCDLVILGQYDPEGSIPSVYADLPEYVTLNGGCPVLIIPYVGSYPLKPEHILIAWDGGQEAAKAVRNALPFLQAAKSVEVAVFNAQQDPANHGEEPGADIALYLARHHVKANVRQEQVEIPVGEALLSLAADLHADLLVMGCYGHSRFREVLLGGVSRTILDSITLPVLMSH
ncbi:universal stress protein [Actimicrobium sp. CCI2.3]|uniref:universal stress protein n=1 Tax=Actimicrobium sp. CCI2.3 TaxID=3048616 RepID=UPI002AB505EC|nr:universal stress protein [Actimicrobium sp. CCI2.3]MDY7575516.1 universal stress protein [Actimicrobium sp. CCI2.3]MEB0023752.1 universal stress protein [Actimicrobium sp. CCI2.3]